MNREGVIVAGLGNAGVLAAIRPSRPEHVTQLARLWR